MALVALAGLLGSGKSSAVRQVLEIRPDATGFVEPEESEYPLFVEAENEDAFGVHSWFRASRVHNLYRASHIAGMGRIALVDSYYDRMLYSYIDSPNFRWLLGTQTSHLAALRTLSEVDRNELPRADQIIFLRVEREAWKLRLKSRNRSNDADIQLIDRFDMQQEMLEACRELAAADASELIEIDTSSMSAIEVATVINEHVWPLQKKMSSR